MTEEAYNFCYYELFLRRNAALKIYVELCAGTEKKPTDRTLRGMFNYFQKVERKIPHSVSTDAPVLMNFTAKEFY